LNDLKVGQTVNVIYDSSNGKRTAQRIEQERPTYVGTVRAIDCDTRTVRAKRMLSEKTFRLADGCRIVINGHADGSLSDLRIGDRITLTYENANGVLVASCLGREPAGTEPEPVQASMASPSHE
jgi:hypothetical protein